MVYLRSAYDLEDNRPFHNRKKGQPFLTSPFDFLSDVRVPAILTPQLPL